MILQIALGALLILATILVGSMVWLGLELTLIRLHGWLMRPPHLLKLVTALFAALVATLAMITVSVWIWALTFYWLDIFGTMEAALYFALVSFTTLGFGDVLLPMEWRLLGGMTAANGFLSFGLVAALLVETMRNIRIGQRDGLS